MNERANETERSQQSQKAQILVSMSGARLRDVGHERGLF